MKRYIKVLSVTIILVAAVIFACNKKLDVFDENNPTTESYFKTASELQSPGFYSAHRQISRAR